MVDVLDDEPTFPAASAAVAGRMTLLLGNAVVRDFWTGIAGCQVVQDPVGAPEHRIFRVACGGARARVKPEAQCDFLASLRDLYVAEYAASASPLPRLNIARECDATPNYPERWDQRLTGQTPASTSGKGAGARVAVVDVSIDPARVVPPNVCAESGSEHTLDDRWWHGTAMTELVRNYAPGAQVLFFRGIHSPEGGPASDVALALMRVRHAVTGGPLVVNLSLGWPPEHVTPQKLSGAQRLTNAVAATASVAAPPPPVFGGMCSVEEGAVGLSVRTQLAHLARRTDTLSMAAAGNRIKRSPNEVYYPAAWSKVAVGVDWYGPIELQTPPSVHLQKHNVPFAAPGGPIRAAGDLPLATGTSFSTAISSGIAAHIVASLSGAARHQVIARLHGVGSDAFRGAQRRLIVPGTTLPMIAVPMTSKTTPPGPVTVLTTPDSPPAVSRWRPSTKPTRYDSGSVGPQPNPFCPNDDCYVLADGIGDPLVVLRPPTPFTSDPQVTLDAGGTKTTYTLLGGASGGTFKISIGAYTATKLGAWLTAARIQSGKKLSVNEEPMSVYQKAP